jgi:hypothetical protein
MLVSTDGQMRSVWSAPRPCPDHGHGRVTRFGTYGKRTAKPRQRYRCVYDKNADGEDVWHTFTPPLPRDHVHESGRSCAECEQLRGVHHGDTAVARRHAWPTRVVARALDQLAMGASYADVSRWALRTAGGRARGRDNRPKDPDNPEPRTPLPRSTASPDVWHIAADWVEAFGPVVWAPVEERLRAQALAHRAANDALAATGAAVSRPQVLLLDDVPVYARDKTTGKSRRDAGFYLLVAAEVNWREPPAGYPDPFAGPVDPPAPEPVAHLRLVPAMAKSNTPAWRLVFDELGYAPEYVVADAGRGLLAAVRAHYAHAATVFVPSVWHLTEAVKEAFADTPGALVAGPAGKELPADIAAHLRLLARGGDALADEAAWRAWWKELEDIIRSRRLPVDAIVKRRKEYEGPMAAALPSLARHPYVPLATGALERLIRTRVQPMLSLRSSGFGNIERTNTLMDLAVARAHGAFDDLAEVATLLRDDTDPAGGWTVPLRSVADPRPRSGRYSSLRDPTLLTTLAAERGLS